MGFCLKNISIMVSCTPNTTLQIGSEKHYFKQLKIKANLFKRNCRTVASNLLLFAILCAVLNLYVAFV